MGVIDWLMRRRKRPDSETGWNRSAALGAQVLLVVYAVFWITVAGLVHLDLLQIQLFGVDAAMVFRSMPFLSYALLTLYGMLVLASLVALWLRYRLSVLLQGLAVFLHLMIWLRVAFNPYMPAWPGLVFVIGGFTCLFLQIALVQRRRM